MRLFASRVLWNAIVRFVLFWSLVAGGVSTLAHIAPYSNWALIVDIFSEAAAGNITVVANEGFAYALSSAILQCAFALGLAFLVAHVILLRLALWSATRELKPASGPQEFASKLDLVSQGLQRNAIVGPAWREFEKTTVRHDDAVHNIIRPQSFINLADARERFFGLKMMASIPGYFVGLGLLLTFMGLVLALNSAATSTAAGSADEMIGGLSKLLSAATFKFSTSIAGLGASLALSLLFRTYQIWIDAGFYRFNRALEARMQFHPTQKIAAESRDILAAQRDELKEINSERFFARLGEVVAPQIEGAMSAAVRPMTDRLDTAMGQLTQTSQTGLQEMLQSFLNTLRGGAGVELTQIARSLETVKGALDNVQQNLVGSGSDFAHRLTEASEAMSRVVSEAASTLGGSATGAAGAMETAMAGVVQKLDAHASAFERTLGSLQAGFTAQAEEVTRTSRQAAEAAAEASRRAAEEAASASASASLEVLNTVRASMDEVVGALKGEVGKLAETLRSVSAAMAAQTNQIETVTVRSRETADVFGRVANDVRAASQPLFSHSERVASATDRMAASVETSVGALATTQRTAGDIAEQLSAHLGQITRVWDQYEARFRSVDEDLGRAADRFRDEVARHQEAMRNFVVEVDTHTESIAQKLSSGVSGLSESVEALNETLDHFLRTVARREAAE